MNWIIHRMKRRTAKKRNIRRIDQTVESWWRVGMGSRRTMEKLAKLKDFLENECWQWLKAKSDIKRHFVFDVNIGLMGTETSCSPEWRQWRRRRSSSKSKMAFLIGTFAFPRALSCFFLLRRTTSQPSVREFAATSSSRSSVAQIISL